MDIHMNARLTLRGREEVVRRATQLGHAARQVARVLHTTDTTVRKWVVRAAGVRYAESTRIFFCVCVDSAPFLRAHTDVDWTEENRYVSTIAVLTTRR